MEIEIEIHVHVRVCVRAAFPDRAGDELYGGEEVRADIKKSGKYNLVAGFFRCRGRLECLVVLGCIVSSRGNSWTVPWCACPVLPVQHKLTPRDKSGKRKKGKGDESPTFLVSISLTWLLLGSLASYLKPESRLEIPS
jgi:hypothetical protein